MRPLPSLYPFAARLLAPLYLGALAWRGFKERGYWHGFGERLGFGPAVGSGPARGGGSLWLHAASVGEVQAGAGLARALARQVPGAALVVTTTTPAGAARARALLGAGTETRADVRFVPIDVPGAVRRFLDRAAPRIGIVMETELWPSLFRECRRRRVPLALASARLSERSARHYGRMSSLIEPALAGCALIAAQSEADAERFRRLGAPAAAVRVVGNIKFDFEVPPETTERGRRLRERYARGRPVWVAGSTHQGEEQAALEAHGEVRRMHPEALLVLAPRHPPRFAEVAALLEQRGIEFERRSQGGDAAGVDGALEDAASARGAAQVLLLDTLGELLDFYAAADVVFVGGSLVPIGGHNLLEPASLARPILTGPSEFNAPEIARLLAARGAVRIVRNASDLGASVSELLANAPEREALGARSRTVIEEHRGALAQLLALLEPLVRVAAERWEPAGSPAKSKSIDSRSTSR
ncbi:MAG TPA: lipid IV(A) 3-deoxy-D-manno-octulosonic acid transferase [Steroidobacteraceae bacterium]